MLAVSVVVIHGLEDIPRIDIPLLQRIASVQSGTFDLFMEVLSR